MNWRELFIQKTATLLNVNLLGLAYRSRGIGLSNDFTKNGELMFLKKYLLDILGKNSPYTFFDVGQNKGEYTQLLLSLGLEGTIHGFEPNFYLYEQLSKAFNDNSSVLVNNFGFGSKKESKELYSYKLDKLSGHGSVYQNVFKDLHHVDDIVSYFVQMDTLENYCHKNNISEIDFLKIDVEGHELEVIKGTGKMLDKIKVIQFEFNEMNIISKVFLKDFYDNLKNFNLYRLTPNGLLPIIDYSSINEIFRIQNIIAKRRR